MYAIRTLPSPAVPSTAYCTLCRAANRAVLSSTPATVAVPYCAALQLQQRQRSLSAVVLNGGAAAATDRAPAHRPSRLHMHCHCSRNLRSGCFHSHPSPKDGLLGHPPALRWALLKFSPAPLPPSSSKGMSARASRIDRTDLATRLEHRCVACM